MRLFVALNFTARDRKKIHVAMRTLRDAEYPVRWLDPGLYHLTLKFLGTVDPRQVDEVKAAVDSAAATSKPFDIEVAGAGAFPTIRKPRVLWVGVDPSPALRCLKQDLEWALSGQGFARETQAFHPHVTIGRALEGQGAGAFRGIDELAAASDVGLAAPVRTLDLMRSFLARDGARYEVIHKSQLVGD